LSRILSSISGKLSASG